MKSRARLAAAITAAVIGLVIGTNVSAGAAVKAAPRVTTSAATSVTATSATLNGIVNPGGLATSYWFQWGTTTTGWSQGQNFTLTAKMALYGSHVNSSVQASLTGLVPGTTYYYETVAQNSKGTRWAGVVSFVTPGTPPPPVTYTVGGSISGLTGTAVLEDNGGDDLSVSADGPFTFATPLTAGAAYTVTVKTPPSGESCTVSGGSGTAQGNVTSVVITCAPVPVYTKVVYLTFDDGPDPLTTPGTLTALETHGAHATFCMIGQNTADPDVGVKPNPGLVKRIYTDGDGLCDHTWDHPDMNTLTDAQQQSEITSDRDAIYSAIGTSNVPLYFRFPYGSGAAYTMANLTTWGLQSPALYWSFDNQDWSPLCPGAAAIQASVESQVSDGAVVLLHDVSYCGVAQMAYVGPLIDWLHANGYDVRAITPSVAYPAQPAPLAPGIGSPAQKLE